MAQTIFPVQWHGFTSLCKSAPHRILLYHHSYRLSSTATLPPKEVKLVQPSLKWWNLKESRQALTIQRDSCSVQIESPKQCFHDTGYIFKRVRHKILTTFLPAGYPSSVSSEYITYTKWNFISSVAGSVTGVLSTQSLLYSIGLGAGSIPLASALNWIIKDGLGQFGGVLYASLTGSRFDSEPKKIRFNATLAMQFATLLELLTPLYPAGFLILASISNIGKNIAWLASSATRAQMHQTFALKDNLGDITAKAGSQATAAGLLGTGIGILISAKTGAEFSNVFFSFLPFSILSIVSTYKSNVVVLTKALNVQRCERLLIGALPIICDPKSPPLTKMILSPSEVSVHDTFLFTQPYQSPFSMRLEINPPLHKLKIDSDCARSTLISTLEKGYVVSYSPHEQIVRLWLTQGCSEEGALKGFLHSMIARWLVEDLFKKVETDRNMKQENAEFEKFYDKGNKVDDIASYQVMKYAEEIVDKRYLSLKAELEEKGWNLENVYIDTDRERRLTVVDLAF